MSICGRLSLATWALLLLECCAQLPSKDWCAAGIAVPDFKDDGGTPSVGAYVVQSPLFSTNPRIGKKLRWLSLFHTAMVFRQEVPGEPARNWTVEFDSVTNVVGAVLPNIENDTLTWNNDARYCVTPGVLWGEAHWSQMFDLALELTSAQARQIFTQFVPSVNQTGHHNRPLYQLWRVTRREPEETLVKDITCGDGINWVLHFASTQLGVSLTSGFELRFTSILFHADRLSSIDVGSEKWPDVVKYFQGMKHTFASNQTVLERLLDVLHLMPVHYVYDGNAKAYFQVVGNHFPWITAQYRTARLEGPPWLSQSEPAVVVV